MTVLVGENAVDESCGPPRKKFRLCLSSRYSQVRTSHENTTSVKGAMLNGYIPTDGHNKSSTDDSPVSDGTGCSPVATLCNLGNTCFLNSVIYTLRFAPAFLHNLHHLVVDLADVSAKQQQVKAKSSSLGRNMGSSSKSWSSKDLLSLGSSTSSNDTQGKSRIQVATERLHELYVALHTSEVKENCDPFQPDVFLHALREVNPIFEGNQQHDAHELLVCLLDNIRETCRLLANQMETRQTMEAADSPENLDIEPKISGAATLPPPSKSWGGVRKSWKKRKNTSSQIKNPSNGLSNGITSSVKDLPSQDSTVPLVNGGTGSHQTLTGISEFNQVQSPPVSSSSDNIKTETGVPESDKDSKKQNVGYNFVADDFEGVAVLRTTCLECEHVTERKETFCDICVPIITEQETEKGEIPRVSEVYQAAIVTSENLRDLNKYWCEQCLRYNEACRSVRYETLPRLLVLQLKRFSSTFGSMVCMSKVNDYMPTPLKLACFCENCCSLPEEQRPHQYQLYGVIMHLGATIASGHYVAYVKASENYFDYCHCGRDKRKIPSLSSGSGKSSGGSGDKMGGILKFFRPKSSSSGVDVASKNLGNSAGNSLSNRNTCRSLDCCGVKLNSSLIGMHMMNGCGELIGHGYSSKDKDSLNPLKALNSLPAEGVSSSTDASVPEPLWLECDDDTVRLLTRKEFEDVLAPKPSKNSALTPYLLFYSRV
ncbi:hypothetical protein R5R35_012693 [Gryllus longicercus]|uniref:USP domain-containing protein n=1 Tax=Gryllus longicercus TaxID=2509291 RepID=A0AAN9V2Z9_9ORTH